MVHVSCDTEMGTGPQKKMKEATIRVKQRRANFNFCSTQNVAVTRHVQPRLCFEQASIFVCASPYKQGFSRTEGFRSGFPNANSRNILFLQIFLKRAAKPRPRNISACSKASQTFSATFSGTHTFVHPTHTILAEGRSGSNRTRISPHVLRV